MADAAVEDTRLAAQASDGLAEFLAQVLGIGAADVGELDVLEVVPHPLVQRVEIGRVAGELHQAQAAGGTRGEEILYGPGAVDGRAIPQDQQLPRNLRQQVVEEAHHVGSPESVVLHL